MPGNNKVKTAKQLQGKKGTGKKDLHPESRRVKQAARVELRTKKIGVEKKERHRVGQDKVDRLLWFIREMDEDKAVLTVDELHAVAQAYLARLDDDIDEEKKQRRPGRAISKRQQELENAKQHEDFQYTKEGILIPDLTDFESVQSARYWDDVLKGNSGYYSRLRLVRVFKGQNDIAVEQKGEPLGPNMKAEIEDQAQKNEEDAMEE